MKKLMFAVAMTSAAVAFGADVSDFEAEEGIYNVTLTKKFLAPTYAKVYEAVTESAETKTEAINAAEEAYAEIEEQAAEDFPGLKRGKTKTWWCSDDEVYKCTINYTYDSEEVASYKSSSVTLNGLLVKGEDFKGEYVNDGCFMVWEKSKDTKQLSGKYLAGDKFPEAAFVGAAQAKKSVAKFAYDGEDATYMGVAFGSATGDYVKTASGSFVADAAETMEGSFGTWKIQKDATATKLAQKGYSLEMLLQKKGATEYADFE